MKRTLFALVVILPVYGQQPRVGNARLESRAVSGGLDAEMRKTIAAQTGAAWAGYAVPMIAGNRDMCCWNSDHCCSGCTLERNGVQMQGATPAAAAGPVHLEGPGTMFVLFRIENKAIDQIRTFTPDCELDAGGLPFFWLTGVRPADSVAFLSATALDRANEPNRSGKDRIGERAVSAIALHLDPAADQALENLVASDKPESIRERTTFWLGSTRGARGAEILKRLVAQDPSDRVREKAIFGLSVSKEPTAVNTMIEAAKNDKSAHVRGQALFWLAQKAGRRETQAITDAIANDPDTQVKKKAVFALEQLPNHEGVPLLIQVARTNKNPEVRKQAMFWLGQSKDPRAVSFFEEVLTK